MRTSTDSKKGKQGVLSLLFALILALGMLPQAAFALESEASTIKVIIDFEGYNLGHGFYLEPTELTVPEGSTAEDVTRTLLAQTNHDLASSGTGDTFYLEGVKGFATPAPVLPSYLSAALAAERPPLTLGSKKAADWLSQKDYIETSGWMVTVNDALLNTGAGGYTAQDGDVLRWQFSVFGFGTDLGFAQNWSEEPTPALYTAADKTALFRALFAPNAVTSAKSAALAVIINPQASAAQVSQAINSLAAENAYKITAPQGATVKVFRQLGNYNLVSLGLIGTVDNEDGTITSWFAVSAGTKHFRVSMPGKITKTGYFSSATTFDATVTFGESEDPSSLGTTSSGNAAKDDANTLINIPGYHNVLNLSGIGDSYKLRSLRAAWQIIDTEINNQMIEPDFHYTILSGSDVISITPDATIPNWSTITALKEGVAVIEVSYDALDVGGGTTSAAVAGRYGATTPTLKALAVVTVGAANGTGADMTIAGKPVWDSEFDIFYILGDEAQLSVSTTEEATITASNPGAGKAETAAVGGSVVVYAGNNIVKSVATDGTITYKVVRVAKITPIFTPEKPALGETFSVRFDGLIMPLPKMSGIYNPAFNATKLHMDGTDADTNGGQYTFSHNTVLTGTYISTNQTIGGGYILSSSFGQPAGTHRYITDTGIGTNTDAPTLTGQLGVLPTIRLADYFEGSVVEPEEITVKTWAQQDDSGFLIADEELTVSSNLSEEYGFDDEYNGEKVTALDALVATHLALFGEVDGLGISSSGFINKVFYDVTGNFVFYVNGIQPGDGVFTPDPYNGGTSQFGYSITQALLEEGDEVLFYELQDSWGMDYFVWFEQDGVPVKSIQAVTGEDIELGLQGYMGYYGYSDPVWQKEKTEVISEAAIKLAVKDDSGSGAVFFEDTLGVTDEDGAATLRFTAPGTYYLSAVDDSGWAPFVSPWLVVTVTEGSLGGLPGSGDVDGDTYVTISDAILILRYIAGLDAFTPAQIAAGNMDSDSVLTIGDAIAVLRKIAGL